MQNKAGLSTRKMEKKRRSSILWVITIVLGGVSVIYFLSDNSTKMGINGIGVLALLVLLGIIIKIGESWIDKIHKDANKWGRGAKAEEMISGLLDDLPADYLVINDVGSPFGNIDHIVIGENSGIILLETKSHHGKVTVENGLVLINGNETEKDFISQTLSNCYWIRETISEQFGIKPWITPIIVFTNAFVPFMPPVRGINLTNKKFLISNVEKIQNRNSINHQVWDKREEIVELLVSSTQ